MKPKDRRDRLFKTSRPNIRAMELVSENGYGKDMGVLWGGYKLGSFKHLPEGGAQEEFADYIMSDVNGYARKWIIEDSNAQFNDKYGAIAMVCAVYNGWELEPHVNFFSWATPRNKLRAMVSFLQMMRYDKEVGIVNANSLEETKGFFHHVVKYGVLKYAAKVPNGDSRGDRYMFYIRGRKDAGH